MTLEYVEANKQSLTIDSPFDFEHSEIKKVKPETGPRRRFLEPVIWATIKQFSWISFRFIWARRGSLLTPGHRHQDPCPIPWLHKPH